MSEAIREDADKTVAEVVEPVVVSDKEVEEAPKEEVVLSERDRIASAYAKRQEEKLSGPEPTPEPEPEPEEVEVKVNGQSRMVPREKVDAAGGIETYQKRLAAEYGMKELAEQREQFKQQQAQFQANQQQLSEQQQQLYQWQQQLESQSLPDNQGDIDQVGDLPDGDHVSKAREYREALLDGDDELADELLVEILESGAQPATPEVDLNYVAAVAADQARQAMQQEAYQRDLWNGQRVFEDEFQDIKADPRLFEQTDLETIRLKNQHPEWSPTQIIREAGTRIRAWASDKGLGAPQTPSKIEAKRAVRTPRASTGRAPATPEPRPMTRSEAIEAMKKARGQG